MNHRDRNFTSAKLERRMRDIEASISRYLVEMDTADRQEPTIAEANTDRLQHKIAALKEQMQILRQVEVKLDATPDKQVSLKRQIFNGLTLVVFLVDVSKSQPRLRGRRRELGRQATTDYR